MKHWYKNILISWEPWCWKSTLIAEFIAWIQHKSWILANQILQDNKRVWFEIQTHDGLIYPLSSTQHPERRLQFWKYFINTESLRQIIKNFHYKVGDLLYLDEIAPMELFAPWFSEFSDSLLDAKNFLIWVIKLDDKDYSYIQKSKTKRWCFTTHLQWKYKRRYTFILRSTKKENNQEPNIYYTTWEIPENKQPDLHCEIRIGNENNTIWKWNTCVWL